MTRDVKVLKTGHVPTTESWKAPREEHHFKLRFLDQFQDLLGWKRINKDVLLCYYQASRLVEFVSEELN